MAEYYRGTTKHLSHTIIRSFTALWNTYVYYSSGSDPLPICSGVLFVPASKMTALNESNGQILWTYENIVDGRSRSFSSAALLGSGLLVAESGGNIFAFAVP